MSRVRKSIPANRRAKPWTGRCAGRCDCRYRRGRWRGCIWLREPLTQFALALILWLAIDGFADTLARHIKVMPRCLALPIAVVIILGLTAVIGFVVVAHLSVMLTNLDTYQARLNEILAQAYGALRQWRHAADRVRSGRAPRSGAGGAGCRRGPAEPGLRTIFTLIFLAFLFPAAAVMPKSSTASSASRRCASARAMCWRAFAPRWSNICWVQTVASLIITALTYITSRIIGLENALFWSFLIFFLNYIPTIGSIVATILPTAIALVQFPTLGPVAATALGVGALAIHHRQFPAAAHDRRFIEFVGSGGVARAGDLGRGVGHCRRVSRGADHGHVDDRIGAISVDALDCDFAFR